MSKTHFTKDAENKMLTIERVFDAPREKVWQAYTDAKAITKWWGPRGWETTVKELEFKPGGTWIYCMKCVDENQGEFYGQESCGKAVYESIDEPNEFTYRDYFADADGNIDEDMPAMTITLQFIEQDGKTKLVSRSIFDTLEGYEKVIAMGVEQGFEETLDRLEEYVAES